MNIEVKEQGLYIDDILVKRIYKRKKKYERETFHRLIYKTDEYIIKVDIDWRNQSEQETEIFAQLDEKDKIYFQPIEFHGKGWNVQKIIKFKRGRRREHYERKVQFLFSKYKLIDYHDENWGVRSDGSLVIFDYGR